MNLKTGLEFISNPVFLLIKIFFFKCDLPHLLTLVIIFIKCLSFKEISLFKY